MLLFCSELTVGKCVDLPKRSKAPGSTSAIVLAERSKVLSSAKPPKDQLKILVNRFILKLDPQLRNRRSISNQQKRFVSLLAKLGVKPMFRASAQRDKVGHSVLSDEVL